MCNVQQGYKHAVCTALYLAVIFLDSGLLERQVRTKKSWPQAAPHSSPHMIRKHCSLEDPVVRKCCSCENTNTSVLSQQDFSVWYSTETELSFPDADYVSLLYTHPSGFECNTHSVDHVTELMCSDTNRDSNCRQKPKS